MANAAEFPTEQNDDFFTIVGNAFQLIKKSWEAVRLNLVTFILVYLAPIIFISAAVTVALPFFFAGNDGATGAGIVLLIIAVTGLIVLSIMLAIASIIVQLASVRGKKISFSEAVNQALPYFWRLVGLTILSILVIGLGFLLFIIPGVLAMFFLLLASYVLIDQKIGIVDAMRKSYEITKAHWKVVGALIIVQFVIGLPAVVPVFGTIISMALAIAYFCLPAIIYLRIAGKGKEVAETTAE